MSNHYAVQALNILSPLLISALTWVATKISKLISARIQNERLRGALLRLDEVVTTVVKETFQVTVDAIKAAAPDHKLPVGVGPTVKQAALAAIKAQLGPKGLAELQGTLNLTEEALDRRLSTKVEAAVYSIKHAATTNGVSKPGDLVPFAG